MSNVENAAVTMTFDSAGFDRGVAAVLGSLENLRASIENSTAKGAFDGLQAEANSFNLGNMESAIDSINNKFSALGAVAFSTLSSITNSAIDAGKRIFDATVGQITTGGKSRSLAIEQAKFQFEGLGQDVEASMQSALDAVRGTAYGLDEAATVAASFGASGILAGDQMTSALRGVAGVAALTNTSFADMGSIFQDVAGQGKLTGAHLFSFASRGINMAAALAKEFGVTEQAVRDMATNGEISFEQFTTAVDHAFGEHATEANKTYTGSLANVRAALSRLGEDIQAPKLEATRNVFNALSPAIDKVADSIAPLIKLWTRFVNAQAIRTIGFLDNLNFKKLDVMMPHIARGFQNLYDAVKRVSHTIKSAFQTMFPRVDGSVFESVAISFKKFTASLMAGEGTLDNIRSIFVGVFSVVKIGWEVFKGLASVVANLFHEMTGVGGGLLEFFGDIGDSLQGLSKALVDNGGIENFFERVNKVISTFIDKLNFGPAIDFVINAFNKLKGIFGDVFGGVKEGGEEVSEFMDRIHQRVDQLTGDGSALRSIFNGIITVLGALADAGRAAFDYLTETFSGLGEALGNSLNEGDFDEVLDVLNVGLLGGLAVMIKKFMDEGLSIDLSGGVLDSIKETFKGLTDVLGTLQQNIRADTLMKIAKAVGILSLSMIGLSLIDSASLTKALTAIAAGFGELVGTMTLMNKAVMTPRGAAKLATVAGAMILMAGAMTLMGAAVAILGHMKLGDLAKGLIGVGVAMGIMVVSMKALNVDNLGLIAAASAMILMGIALNVIAAAIKLMGSTDLDDLVKGLVGLGVALAGITIAMRFMSGAEMIPIGIGLGLIALSLVAIAAAVNIMAAMSWPEMLKGLAGLGIALAGIAAFGAVMEGELGGAVALGIMAASLIGIAIAIRLLGDMKGGDIVKGLLAMAGAMVVVALGGSLLGLAAPEIIAGAAALGAMSIAMILLAAGLKALGSLSLGQILVGLLALAASILVIAGVSALLSEAIPLMLAMGAAMLLVGLGMVALGAGAYLLARAFEIIGKSTVETRQAMLEFLGDVIKMIPELAIELAEGIVALLDIVLDALPGLVEGLITILGDLLDGVVELAPKFGEAVSALLTVMLSIFEEQTPAIIEAGLGFLQSFLEGIQAHMPAIVDTVKEIIISFLNGLTIALPQIIDAAATLIVTFINGLSNNLDRIINAGTNLVVQVINGISNGIDRIINAGANLVIKFFNGLGRNLDKIIQAGVTFVKSVITGVVRAVPELITAAANGMIDMGLACLHAIEEASSKLNDVAYEAGKAAGRALGNGASSMKGFVQGAFAGLLESAEANLGLVDKVDAPIAVDHPANKDSFDIGLSDDIIDIQPVITPSLDLSGVEQESSRLSKILGATTFVPDISMEQAQRVFAETTAPVEDDIRDEDRHSVKEINYNQTINAPRQLSTGDIYRETKGLVAMAKDEMEIDNAR